MDITMSVNRSIKDTFYTEQLHGWIKLEENRFGQMTLTFQMTSSSENTLEVFSKDCRTDVKAQVGWAQTFWTRSKRLSVLIYWNH